MTKQTNFTYSSVVLFICIVAFGFINRAENRENITWSVHPLDWKDFQEVKYIEDDYVAIIYSEIFYPKSITKSNPLVYAYMNPNLSGHLKDSMLDNQLLIHEQYHFNITEYYARQLRRAIVEKGKDELSKSELKALHKKYERQKETMQETYDHISDHNIDSEKQRYWELKIDHLLRKTAYYQSPDIYSYYEYEKGETNFYKHIYNTFDYQILSSYPIAESNLEYGESYEVIREDKNVVVKFYKNGTLSNGGQFETAITKIENKGNGIIERHFYNPDMTYNISLPYCILKSTKNDKNDKIIHYLNEKRTRIANKKIYEIQWHHQADSSMYASYLDINKNLIDNEDGVRHEKRSFDSKGRTIKIESFGANHKPKIDNEYVATNHFVFDDDHKIIQDKSFDESGKFAFHLDDYYLEYTYDERGNLLKSFTYDENGNRTNNKDGVGINEYTHDLYDNATSISRYNKNEVPILGSEDYFRFVMDYDSYGKSKFDASYYPGNILKFDDSRNGAVKYEYLNDSIVLEYNVDAFNQVFNNDVQIAIIKKYLNSKKQVIKEEYLDYEKYYAKTKSGAVININKYDSAGNKVEQTSQDSIGNIISFESDVATVRWEYDELNNKIKTTYFNKSGKLALANQNVTYNVYVYNEKNELVERMNYDKKMRPELLDGAFKTEFYINRIGKDSLMKEYDKSNKLIKGVSSSKYEYDKYGNDTKDKFFDASGRSIKNSNGVHFIRYNYDDKRRYLGFSYFDEFDQPVVSLEGYHKKKFLLNDIGEIIKISTYGKDLLLIENDDGIAEYEYTIEASGLRSNEKYYNKNHQLVDNNDGIAQIFYSSSLNGLYYLEKQLDAKGVEVIEKE